MHLPDNADQLLRMALILIEQCRTSQGRRAALYRQYNSWCETGRQNNSGRAWVNKMYAHIDKLQSNLYSPTNLAFDIDFENPPEKMTLMQGSIAAKGVTRMWERNNIDLEFGVGVNVACVYGAAHLKQQGFKRGAKIGVSGRIVMPWQFGVLQEAKTELDDQDCFVESTPMTEHEVWHRIKGLPDAVNLFKRIIAHARKDAIDEASQSFFHQVLSTSILGTSPVNQPKPGGIVNLNADSSMGVIGPEDGVDTVLFHELWVKDDKTGDYATIQIVEPDILVAPSPLMKRTNLFCENLQPYTKIVVNHQPNYYWGRSELVDLMTLQNSLDDGFGDIKRIMGVLFDKLLAFAGADGITDEIYDQFRNGGFINMGQGGSVTDVTPQLPPQAFEYLTMINQFFDEVSGFDNILSGKGESGVRSGMQTSQLARYASPRLRDRALLVERQVAAAGDKTLGYMEAKDDTVRWVHFEDTSSEFLLDQLPDDRRITVDSHSSSPIYEEDHQQLVAFGVKAGFVTGGDAIDLLPFPHKDKLHQSLKDKQEAEAKLIAEHPELLQKHGKGGHK